MDYSIDRPERERRSAQSIGLPDYDQSPVFIASSEGPKHRFTFANAAYKRLIGHEDLIGRLLTDVIPEICEQGFITLLDRVYATGEPFVGTSMPVEFGKATGARTLHYITFVFQPVRDESGQITGLFCEGFDVTAERLATDRLAALQNEVAHVSRVNAMSMMATTIAHELNQPLSAIRNYAAGALRMLEEPDACTDQLVNALRSVDEAADRAGEIISNVRMLMRRGETVRTAFALRPAIDECIRLVSSGAASRAAVENAVSADLTTLGDRLQLQQVVINLLRNALDAVAGSPNARVVIGAVLADMRLTVSVADNGPGLSPASASTLFEWTDSAKEGGLGLGLAISRAIVESHGGSIWIADTGPSGSTFCFSIPAGPESGEADSGG